MEPATFWDGSMSHWRLLVRRNLDTFFERDIIIAHTIIQHRQEALKANQSFSASFGLPVGVLLFGAGICLAPVGIIDRAGRGRKNRQSKSL